MKMPPSASASPPIQTTQLAPKRSSKLFVGGSGSAGGGGAAGGCVAGCSADSRMIFSISSSSRWGIAGGTWGGAAKGAEGARGACGVGSAVASPSGEPARRRLIRRTWFSTVLRRDLAFMTSTNATMAMIKAR
jgi:hypothetical protein